MKDLMPIKTGSRGLNWTLGFLILAAGFMFGRVLYRLVEGGGF